MALFKKHETLVSNIAYMAIMVAINAVFILLVRFIPFLQFLLIFVLPLTNAIVTLFCKKRYFLIYAFATLVVTSLIAWNLFDTFFYIIPSIISGFLFGVMIEKKVSSVWIITITVVVQVGFTILSIPIIKFLFNQDIINAFITLFKLTNFKYNNFIIPSFIFFISLLQSVLAFAIIQGEIPKMGYQVSDDYESNVKGILYVTLFSLIAIWPFIYVNDGEYSFVMLLLATYFITFIVFDFFKRRHLLCLVLLGLSIFLFIFAFALLYKYVKEPFGILLIGILYLLLIGIGFTNNYLSMHRRKDTITK